VCVCVCVCVFVCVCVCVGCDFIFVGGICKFRPPDYGLTSVGNISLTVAIIACPVAVLTEFVFQKYLMAPSAKQVRYIRVAKQWRVLAIVGKDIIKALTILIQCDPN
jgi:hypothetical protein